jgi:hypothetical protein
VVEKGLQSTTQGGSQAKKRRIQVTQWKYCPCGPLSAALPKADNPGNLHVCPKPFGASQNPTPRECGTVAEEKKMTQFQISGEDPLRAVAPTYSNFVGISRVGTDIQFEFIFLDLNQLAQILEQSKTLDSPERQVLAGKTVAKIVMPGVNFLQVREQFEKIMNALEEEVKKLNIEVRQ